MIAEGEPRHDTLVVAVLALCGTVVSLQQTMLLPLLPDLLGTTSDNSTWLLTATLLAGAVSTPILARLADMRGKRLMLLISLTAVTVGGTLGSLVEQFPLLVVARLIMGIGLALIPVGIATMRDELPPSRVPVAVALMSASLAFGAAVGLPLGGLVAAHLSWRGTFWVPALLAAALFVAVHRLVHPTPRPAGGRFDVVGAVLLGGALTSLLLLVSKGALWGIGDPRTIAAIILAVTLLFLWVPWEYRVRDPLVDLRTSTTLPVVIANVVSLLVGLTMFANMLISSQALQAPTSTPYGQGLSEMHAGLWMVPGAAVFGLMAPVSAKITRRYGPVMTILAGSLLSALAYGARIWLTHSVAEIVIGAALVAAGSALAFSGLPTLIMGVVPAAESAQANGLNTLLRSIGTSAASAGTAAIFAVSAASSPPSAVLAVTPSLGGLQLVTALAALASALAAVACLPILRRGALDGYPR